MVGFNAAQAKPHRIRYLLCASAYSAFHFLPFYLQQNGTPTMDSNCQKYYENARYTIRGFYSAMATICACLCFTWLPQIRLRQACASQQPDKIAPRNCATRFTRMVLQLSGSALAAGSSPKRCAYQYTTHRRLAPIRSHANGYRNPNNGPTWP